MRRVLRQSNRLVRLLGSNQFFWLILAVFVAEAAWIAFTGRFPMASDEDFHLSVIQLHAQQWWPFFASQPDGADHLGAVVRDPSFLYHYLASFPYRLADRFFHGNLYPIVMSLRLMDILLFAAGIAVYRKVILAAKASPALAHAVLLFFVLTPIVPFVAAQVNYDNLLFPLSGLVFLLTLRLLIAIRQQKVPVMLAASWLALCMVTSMVKYAFLPVFATLVVFVAVVALKTMKPRVLWQKAKQSFARASQFVRTGTVALLVVVSGLFAATYGYNTIKYATPAPECDQVLNIERCKAFGSWNRNYTYAQTKPDADPNPVLFSKTWGANYLRSTFFAINGIYSGFLIGVPLPVLYYTVLAVFWTGLLLIIWQRKKLFSQQQPYVLLGFVSAAYVAVLWIQNYSEYVRLDEHVAEQGRYVLVILPLVYLLVAQSVRLALAGVSAGRRLGAQAVIVVVLLAAFSQGGGALTYIVRSDYEWWWKRPRVVRVNERAQEIVRPWIYDSHVARKEDMPGNYE